ncbi:MAG: NAD(P)H-dependent oxidoreductase [Sediminicola sp.]
MRHLIVYAHPHEKSLNHFLKETVLESLQAKNHEIVVRDLYQLNFDPILSLKDMNGQRSGKVTKDVQLEQDFIRWADHITFVYPIWWTGMPAIMKGYIDRVFSYGFAYSYDQGVQKGLLAGKRTVIINTHGKSYEEYRDMGMDRALSLTSDKGIFSYCGFQIDHHLFFDQADRATGVKIKEWGYQIKDIFSE